MNPIDFLPSSYHEQRRQQGLARRRWILVVLTFLTLVGWGIARHQRSADLAWRVTSLETQVSVSQQKRSEMDKLRLERKHLMYQQDIQRQLEQPVAVTQAVAAVGQLLPDSVGLTHVRVVSHRPEPEPLPDKDEKKRKSNSKKKSEEKVEAPRDYLEIEVLGHAPDDVTVTDLVNAMSGHPLFDKVSMPFSRVDHLGDLVTRSFRILAEVPLNRRYVPLTQTAGVTDED